jgi:Protein of unknown function (DUF3617)
MKMHPVSFSIISAFALASCGKGDVELKNASVEEVAKAAAGAQSISPGNWATTVEVVSVDLPGLPQQAGAMKDQMTKAMTGRKTVSEQCVTQEQAQKPPADMLAGDKGGNCRFESYAIKDGRMDATMVCAPKAGGQMKMQMAGPFGSDAYALDATMQVSAPGMPGGAPMTIKTKVTGKRSGECKA